MYFYFIKIAVSMDWICGTHNFSHIPPIKRAYKITKKCGVFVHSLKIN